MGRASPPKATTYCISVSFTRNLLESAKKGIAIQKCKNKPKYLDFS
jgi:hypothetical protein